MVDQGTARKISTADDQQPAITQTNSRGQIHSLEALELPAPPTHWAIESLRATGARSGIGMRRTRPEAF